MTIASTNKEPQATELIRWPRWCSLLPLVPLLVLAASALEPERRLVIALSPKQPALSDPFPLTGGPLGSPLISLQARLPANSSLVLAAELLDPRGALALQLNQQAWRQSGSWQEQGETGSWEENETEAQLSFRPQRSGSHRLRLTAAELLNETNQPLQTIIEVQVQIRQHSVDAPLLWFTAGITQAMVSILRSSVYGGWRRRQVWMGPVMPLERRLILALTITAVGVSTTNAVTRPLLYRLGQEGTPSAPSGVSYGGFYRNGIWVSQAPTRDWWRFQGRGPGSAK